MAGGDDPFELARFVAAQEGTYGPALAEIRAGAKRGHWMWFVLPQIAGLGTSGMARRYAITSLGEARAYLAHPVLGPRYRDCVAALRDIDRGGVVRAFGSVDAMKLRSSLTLFARAGDTGAAAALDRCFEAPDAATLDRIAAG